MILVIDALNEDRFADVLAEMFRLRARVFGRRLGWDVTIRDGMEIDAFDALKPAYVVGLDDEGHVVSCVRALQTTGPHMLSDVFSDILDGEPPLRSPTIWESTRFCVDTERLGRSGGRNSVSQATCELMIGSLEFAMESGITDIITVIDPVMDRVLRRSNNAPYDYVGSQKPMGKVAALAALLDCSEERVARVRAFAGITGDVFADEDAVRALLDERAAKARKSAARMPSEQAPGPVTTVTRNEILAYCGEQLRTARSVEDLEAAMQIARALLQSQPSQELETLLDRQVN